MGNFGEGFGKEEDDIYEQKMKVGEGNVCGDWIVNNWDISSSHTDTDTHASLTSALYLSSCWSLFVFTILPS